MSPMGPSGSKFTSQDIDKMTQVKLNNWFNRALRLAMENSPGGKRMYSMGAIIIKGNRVVSQGVNGDYNAKVERLNRQNQFPKLFYSEHAEINAILGAENLVRGCTIVVAGYKPKSKNTRLCSRPCPNCMKMLRQVGIKHCIFRDLDGSIRSIDIV